MPYIPYSKQCRMYRRSSVPMKLLADMICKAGASRIVSLDLYRKEIQGFFQIPVDNLRASPFLLKYVQENINYRNAVVVAKSTSVVNKATSFADRLRLEIAVIHGEQKDIEESGSLDGRQSPAYTEKDHSHTLVQQNSAIRSTFSTYELFPSNIPKEKPPLTIVGNVTEKDCIIVDDILDDAHSFVTIAHALKSKGANKIFILATHGLLSADSPDLLESSPIDEIIVTNTVPHDLARLQCSKIKTVDISLLLSEAIRRIFNNESMGPLFRDLTFDD